MGQPPQRHRDRAQRAERDAQIFRLKLAGGSERDIAKAVGVSPTTVHRVVSDRARATVQPLADEFRDLELARLDSALVRATAIMNDPKAMDGDRLKAVASVVRISESRRRLLGLDAPVSLTVAQEAQVEIDGALVADALGAAVAALELPPDQAQFALAMAVWVLGGKEGPLPERPAPRLALMPAPPAAPEPPSEPEEPPSAPAWFRATGRRSVKEAEPPADPEWSSQPRELRARYRPNVVSRQLVDDRRDPFNSPR